MHLQRMGAYVANGEKLPYVKELEAGSIKGRHIWSSRRASLEKSSKIWVRGVAALNPKP